MTSKFTCKTFEQIPLRSYKGMSVTFNLAPAVLIVTMGWTSDFQRMIMEFINTEYL